MGYAFFRARLFETGRNEVTALLPHYRNAWDLITAAETGTAAVIYLDDNTEVPCVVTGRDLDEWTVTVRLK